jgi:hypothetical protein
VGKADYRVASPRRFSALQKYRLAHPPALGAQAAELFCTAR